MIHRDPETSVRTCQSDAKWAVVIDDQLFPMPRKVLTREQMLQQAGKPTDHALVRDRSSTHDQLIEPGATIDLAQGNVFRLLPPCTTVQSSCDAPPKLAFILDDAFEVTVTGEQTLESLLGLFNANSTCELVRDNESPDDEPLKSGEKIRFEDGPVFSEKVTQLTILVNKNEVKLDRKRQTGGSIKKAAIAQGVKIDMGCVLYSIKCDGSMSASIGDNDRVDVVPCMEFRCVAPDDNS